MNKHEIVERIIKKYFDDMYDVWYAQRNEISQEITRNNMMRVLTAADYFELLEERDELRDALSLVTTLFKQCYLYRAYEHGPATQTNAIEMAIRQAEYALKGGNTVE